MNRWPLRAMNAKKSSKTERRGKKATNIKSILKITSLCFVCLFHGYEFVLSQQWSLPHGDQNMRLCEQLHYGPVRLTTNKSRGRLAPISGTNKHIQAHIHRPNHHHCPSTTPTPPPSQSFLHKHHTTITEFFTITPPLKITDEQTTVKIAEDIRSRMAEKRKQING